MHLQVTAIFNRYLDRPPDTEVAIDRVHRTLGPRPTSQDRPRDTPCRLHVHKPKEEIVQQAWKVGILEFDGVPIQLLPEVSRKTLLMHRAPKPLLERIVELGMSYTWGHPFHLKVRKGNRSFPLRHPSELPDLFNFAKMEPIPVPNCLS